MGKKNVNVNGQALHCTALHNSRGHCSLRTPHPLESWQAVNMRLCLNALPWLAGSVFAIRSVPVCVCVQGFIYSYCTNVHGCAQRVAVGLRNVYGSGCCVSVRCSVN